MHGKNIIGFELSGKGEQTIHSVEAATGNAGASKFHLATQTEMVAAVEKAWKAFQDYAQISGIHRAGFLYAIAEEILKLDAELIQMVEFETGLTHTRIVGERGRTVQQLRSFGDLAKSGTWRAASIDTAQPDRTPVPKPDLRKQREALGPVAVFGAGNFPLAFSTAGGDTASALAAGCPVVYKAHEGHPGTSELVGMAIWKAAEKTNMPEGVFNLLHGNYDLNKALAQEPRIKALGFTGSYLGGKTLFEMAHNRPEPIPAFCEMGSINPLIILKGALEKDPEGLASQVAGSISLGAGQFCTKPGLILVESGPGLSAFTKALEQNLRDHQPQLMLNDRTRIGFQKKVTGLGLKASGPDRTVQPVLLSLEEETFRSNPGLMDEVFGPFACLVTCKDPESITTLTQGLPGQLTATLHASEQELVDYPGLIKAAKGIAGRLIFNGVPTGVEVCPSMHHGGPWPASTESRFTSVGIDAIQRFSRPVCYQNWPDASLPRQLQDSNPLNIMRRINGTISRKPVEG